MSENKKVTIATEATALAEEAAAAEAAAPVETVATDTPVSAYDPELLALIKKYGGDESVLDKLEAEYGVGNVSDLTMLKEDELAKAGLKLVKVRAMMKDLQEAEANEAAAEAATKVPTAPVFTADYNMVLPAPSTNESFLKALQTGGMLNISDATYEAGLRVYLADTFGLYEVDDRILDAMDKWADDCDAAVPNAYWDVYDSITRRDYSDLFSAMKRGPKSSYANPKRRKVFKSRVRDELLPAIRDAYNALDGWYKSEMAATSNPGLYFDGMMRMMSGAGVGGLGVTHAPTDPVLDASNTLKDKINHVFRGTAGPVAGALAKDAIDAIEHLNIPDLPLYTGSPNRDMMLKKLGIGITANYVRLEQSLVRFVLGYVKFDEAVGNEVPYLYSLWTLGTQIDWGLLGVKVDSGSRVSAIGGNNML